MKRISLLLIAVFFTALQGFGQVRPDIESFDENQQILLLNAMKEYINEEIVFRHCQDITNHMMYNVHIHDDFNFLPFHRAYLEGMEDYLLSF